MLQGNSVACDVSVIDSIRAVPANAGEMLHPVVPIGYHSSIRVRYRLNQSAGIGELKALTGGMAEGRQLTASVGSVYAITVQILHVIQKAVAAEDQFGSVRLGDLPAAGAEENQNAVIAGLVEEPAACIPLEHTQSARRNGDGHVAVSILAQRISPITRPAPTKGPK